jgi:hypothetical protein
MVRSLSWAVGFHSEYGKRALRILHPRPAAAHDRIPHRREVDKRRHTIRVMQKHPGGMQIHLVMSIR